MRAKITTRLIWQFSACTSSHQIYAAAAVVKLNWPIFYAEVVGRHTCKFNSLFKSGVTCRRHKVSWPFSRWTDERTVCSVRRHPSHGRLMNKSNRLSPQRWLAAWNDSQEGRRRNILFVHALVHLNFSLAFDWKSLRAAGRLDIYGYGPPSTWNV